MASERDRAILEEYLGGMRQTDLAAKYGLTQGRISHILRAQAPNHTWRHPRRRTGREPAHWQVFRERASKATICPICGYWSIRPWITCSQECASIYHVVIDLIRPDLYERRRRYQAKYMAERRPDWKGMDWRKHAERTLSGKSARWRYFLPTSRRRRIALLLGLAPRLDRSRYLFP